MTTILWIDSVTESKPQNSIEYKTFTVSENSIVLFFFVSFFSLFTVFDAEKRTTFCIQIKETRLHKWSNTPDLVEMNLSG